ncbi:MAG: hypothetical protein HKN92_11840, partial [Chitinophagales bacterium]|nr:hypothetical protein [Chitinophagales bacterium]
QGSMNLLWDIDGNGVIDHFTDSFCAIYNAPGVYESVLIVSDTNGCADTISKRVTLVDYPEPDIQSDDVCLGEVSLFLNNSSSIFSPIISYSWNIDSVHFSDEENTSFVFADTGIHPFHLQIINEEGCVTDFNGYSMVHLPVNLKLRPIDTTICSGDSVRLNASGADFYAWQGSQGAASYITVAPMQSTTYEVEGSSFNCPAAIAEAIIRVIPAHSFEIEEIATDFNLGQSYRLQTINPILPYKILWSPDTAISCIQCFNPVISPIESMYYYASAYWRYNGVICSESDSVLVEVQKKCDEDLVFLPNAFSPDLDGKNDVFYVRGRGIKQVKRFSVFNRWGEKIYENVNFEPNNEYYGWTGNSINNEKLNTGVYVYFVEVICENGDKIDRRGNVQLIR